MADLPVVCVQGIMGGACSKQALDMGMHKTSEDAAITAICEVPHPLTAVFKAASTEPSYAALTSVCGSLHFLNLQSNDSPLEIQLPFLIPPIAACRW